MNEWDLNDCLDHLNDVRCWTNDALYYGKRKEISLMIEYIEKINISLTGALAALASFFNNQDNQRKKKQEE